MTSEKKRNGVIDIVKFLASLIVFICHLNNIGLGNIGNAGNTLALVVELFFIISGFFLVAHLDHLPAESNETTWTYVINKTKGFFAPLCIANFIQFFLYCRMYNLNSISEVAAKFWHFKWEFLNLQCLGAIQNPQFDLDYLLGQTWYLSAMTITLVILYPMAKHYRKIFVNIICPISILIIYSAFVNEFGTTNTGNEHTLIVLDARLRAFAGQCCGVICYYAYNYIVERELFNTTAYKIIDTVAWFMFIPLMVILAFNGIHDSSIFFIIPMFLIVISAMLGNTPISSQLARIPGKITDFMGKMSLYIYLTHYTILLVVYSYMPSLNSLTKIVLSVLLTLVYSLILYMLDRKRKSAKPIIVICTLALACSFIQVLF